MNDIPTVKRSLILAGGGMRLAYHAGVLLAMEEEQLVFNHIDGTSGGIFGTAMLASGILPAEAAARWRKLNLNGFMTALPLNNYRNQHSLPAIGSADGVRKKIFPSLGIDVKKINANTAFDATFNVCNFASKSVEAIPHQSVTEDHLIAGISLPVFMPAVKIDGVFYTDAVWLKDANLTEAVNRGAEEIWLIWCIGNTPEYLNGFFNQYVHMIEMSANGGLVVELDFVKTHNSMRINNGLKPVIVHLIEPEYPLPLDPDFFLNKINADTLVNMGYADTKRYLSQKHALSLQDNARAIAMKSPGPTLHFRQQFEGRIMFDNISLKAIIRLSFFVHETKDGYVWRQYSSVEFDSGVVTSGYQNTVTAAKGIITGLFVINFFRQPYNVLIELQLNNTIDFLIGLDIQSARVTISATGERGNSSIFYQHGLTRIKNAFYMNIKAEKSWWGKLISKKRILNTVFK